MSLRWLCVSGFRRGLVCVSERRRCPLMTLKKVAKWGLKEQGVRFVWHQIFRTTRGVCLCWSVLVLCMCLFVFVFLSASYLTAYPCLCFNLNSVRLDDSAVQIVLLYNLSSVRLRLNRVTQWSSRCPGGSDPSWARITPIQQSLCVSACVCAPDNSVHVWLFIRWHVDALCVCVCVCVCVSMTQRDSRAKKWLKWPQLHFHGNRVF